MEKSSSKLRGRRIFSGINLFIIPIVILCILVFPLFSAFFTKTSQNFPEQFIGKDHLISLVNNFRLKVLKDRIFKDLYVSENNWLVYTGGPSLDDIQNTNQFSQSELAQLTDRVKSLCSRMTNIGTRLIIMIPPNKNTIYPEFIPPVIQLMNKGSRLDQFMAAWENTATCKVVDLRDALFRAKLDNQVYFSTDTHWTDLGAFIGYQELAKMMKEDFPAIEVHELSDYEQIKYQRTGDLAGKNFGSFKIEETAISLVPKYTVGHLARYYISSSGMNTGAHNAIFTFTDNTDLPNAVIFYDSFFNVFLTPYLMDSFNTAYLLFSSGIDLELVEKTKPDFMIIEITERNLEIRLLQLPQLD